jgi:O-antigen ligase
MLRLARFCLLTQIVLAPMLLGGMRDWAMAVLSILTGMGLLAVYLGRCNVVLSRPLVTLWAVTAGLIGWTLIQSLPTWPTQDYPFNAGHIALDPDAWIDFAGHLIWLSATVTLGSTLARQARSILCAALIKALIIACTLQVAIAALSAAMDWNTTFWFTKTAHLADWTGSFANRNAFGALMATGMIGCVYLFMRDDDLPWGSRIDQSGGMLALACIFAFALLQSHSRSAVLMVIIGLLVFVMMTRTERPTQKTAGLMGCAALAALWLIAAIPELTERFGALLRHDLLQRDDAWQTAIIAIMDRSLTGYGPDGIALAMAHFAVSGLNTNANWFSSHNLFLDAAMIFGVPVTLVLITCAVIAFKTLLSCARNRRDRAFLTALISIGFIGAMTGWVFSMPALILPLLLIAVTVYEGALATSSEAFEPDDHVVQSQQPDQTVSH